MVQIRQYDASLAAKITATGRESLNDMIVRMPPKDAETWHGTIIAGVEETKQHVAATAWLHARKANFRESFTGVYWIEDEVVAVEFKLLFT